jgi:hypothetical protein
LAIGVVDLEKAAPRRKKLTVWCSQHQTFLKERGNTL